MNILQGNIYSKEKSLIFICYIIDKNHNIFMRRRNSDYYFIDPMIIKILEKSETPLQALCVNFRINEISGKLISLNVVKRHLKDLVEKKKIVKNINEDERIFYTLK